MAKDDIGIEDIFAQWAPINGAYNGTNSTTQEETEIVTGLALFGDRAWAMHRIEFHHGESPAVTFKARTADAYNAMLLGVGKPNIAINLSPGVCPPAGMIAQDGLVFGYALETTGAAAIIYAEPRVWEPPTPVPYASNKISLYARSTVDDGDIQAAPVAARIYYTFIPTTPELYRELQERWALE